MLPQASKTSLSTACNYFHLGHSWSPSPAGLEDLLRLLLRGKNFLCGLGMRSQAFYLSTLRGRDRQVSWVWGQTGPQVYRVRVGPTQKSKTKNKQTKSIMCQALTEPKSDHAFSKINGCDWSKPSSSLSFPHANITDMYLPVLLFSSYFWKYVLC